jgi:hypothetical protein
MWGLRVFGLVLLYGETGPEGTEFPARAQAAAKWLAASARRAHGRSDPTASQGAMLIRTRTAGGKSGAARATTHCPRPASPLAKSA